MSFAFRDTRGCTINHLRFKSIFQCLSVSCPRRIAIRTRLELLQFRAYLNFLPTALRCPWPQPCCVMSSNLCRPRRLVVLSVSCVSCLTYSCRRCCCSWISSSCPFADSEGRYEDELDSDSDSITDSTSTASISLVAFARLQLWMRRSTPFLNLHDILNAQGSSRVSRGSFSLAWRATCPNVGATSSLGKSTARRSLPHRKHVLPARSGGMLLQRVRVLVVNFLLAIRVQDFLRNALDVLGSFDRTPKPICSVSPNCSRPTTGNGPTSLDSRTHRKLHVLHFHVCEGFPTHNHGFTWR